MTQAGAGELMSGNTVAVRLDGKLIGVGRVATVNTRKIICGIDIGSPDGRHGRNHITMEFKRKTRTQWGGGATVIEPIDPAEYDARLAELIAEKNIARVARELADREAAEAAYAALPDVVKLTRRLAWLMDTVGEKTFAALPDPPMDALRAVIKWASLNDTATPHDPGR